MRGLSCLITFKTTLKSPENTQRGLNFEEILKFLKKWKFKRIYQMAYYTVSVIKKKNKILKFLKFLKYPFLVSCKQIVGTHGFQNFFWKFKKFIIFNLRTAKILYL